MYLKKLTYKNVGPLSDLTLDMPFKDDGSPKPLIIVGENGSGKTTLLSNIVDSFYEMAGIAFSDVRFSEGNNSYQYYKVIGADQIRIDEKYLFSYIQYDNSINYVFKSGEYSFEEFKKIFSECPNKLNWGKKINDKKISATEQQVEEIFGGNIFCYFGADRYEKPAWLGEKYYLNETSHHISISDKIIGRIPNPISVSNVTESNLQWLLDLVVDSRPDIVINNNKIDDSAFIISDLELLGSARKQVEQILSNIINQDVFFGLNYRNGGKSRFNICLRKNGKMIVPTLDSLSTGEIALFNMFSSIVRYADKLNINSSFNFNDIKGIVVIDEIELHLHPSLQYEVLPKLIKLFPNVQFVITTHSPLFLLGMRRFFEDEGFVIYQLPTGNQITVEAFTEFKRAFDYMTETQQYQNEIQKAIRDVSSTKPLIITEGATDWRHIKAAINALSCQEDTKDLLESIDVDFLKFDPKNSDSYSDIKLEMGNSTLCGMCKEFAKIKQLRKLIFIADRDDAKTNNLLGGSNTEKYKSWGNNVYSILLPVPSHRSATPNICIEHYYTDDEIKTSVEIEGVKRRLYIANEFDTYGRGINDEIMCEKSKVCGENRINIIEGSQGERVLKTKSGCNENLALSKMEFAKRILKKEPPFDKMCFDSFLELFEIIKKILSLPLV